MTEQSWRGRVGVLVEEEVAEFLEEPVFARLATLDADGWPYVVPVWHEWSDSRFWVVGRERSSWAAHLVRDPRCAVTIDETGTQRKVIAQCQAEISEEPNLGGAWVAIAERMSIRYLGENGPKYLEPTLKYPRWLIALHPVRMWTWQGNDWASRYKEIR